MSEIEVHFTEQAASFWIAAAVGAALCLLYDVFRILRLARRPSSLAAFFQDVAWFSVSAVVTYGLMLVRCKGEVRAYALLGEALGFVICRLTVSRALLAAAKPVIRWVRAAMKVLDKRVKAPCLSFIKKILSAVNKALKKFMQLLKNLLKRALYMVYNPHKRNRSRLLKRRSKSEDGKTS